MRGEGRRLGKKGSWVRRGGGACCGQLTCLQVIVLSPLSNDQTTGGCFKILARSSDSFPDRSRDMGDLVRLITNSIDSF